MVKNLAIRGAHMQIPSVFAAVCMRKTPAACADLRSRRAAQTEAGRRTFPASRARRKPF